MAACSEYALTQTDSGKQSACVCVPVGGGVGSDGVASGKGMLAHEEQSRGKESSESTEAQTLGACSALVVFQEESQVRNENGIFRLEMAL